MNPDVNPFQSPKLAPPSAPMAAPTAWIIPFESGHGRATWTVVLLGIIAMLNVAGTANSYTRYNFFMAHPVPTIEQTRDPASALLAALQWLVAIGAIIAFSMWTHRAARNLPSLGGRGLRFTPGWAVGWFFIPVADFVMPFLVFGEIWRESDPRQRSLNGTGGKESSPLVGCWWGAILVWQIITFGLTFFISIPYGRDVVRAVSAGPNSVELLKVMGEYLPRFCLLGIAANVMEFVAAVLAILLVRAIDKNQQAKYELLLNEPTMI